MDYSASLIGFHNPKLHNGITPEQFLDLYVKSQKEHFKKKDGWKRKRLVDWIEQHKKDQVKFVSRLFPYTLKASKPIDKEAS